MQLFVYPSCYILLFLSLPLLTFLFVCLYFGVAYAQVLALVLFYRMHYVDTNCRVYYGIIKVFDKECGVQ